MGVSCKKLILYGAGVVGKYMAEELIFKGVLIECFCDRDETKSGKCYVKIPVRTIEEVKTLYPKGSFYILPTMKKDTAETVKKNLIAEEIFAANDFYDEDIDPLQIMPVLSAFPFWQDHVTELDPLLKERFRYLTTEKEEILRNSYLTNFMYVDSYDKLTSDYALKDLSDHIYGRLEHDRRTVIPWLNSVQCLCGASVLEIGCGTGASTVALCEQGARVTAIDIDEKGIEVAKTRLQVYGLTAEFFIMNATNMISELSGEKFDFIIFFASLEHMTFTERIQSIRAAFKLLNTSGHLALVEIPNRLWYLDNHTSMEPFFHWLPDELAMEYAKYTSRVDFNQGFDSKDEVDALRFARWGRGVSYHEFEVALGGREYIQVESSMQSFYNQPCTLFQKMLCLLGPDDIHEGFYTDHLNLCMKSTR